MFADRLNITEIDLTNFTAFDMGSINSGDVVMSMDTLTPDQMAILAEAAVVVQSESIGQLYAYRLSEQQIVLGTRNMRIFGAAIGISSENATGSYVCFADNGREEATETVAITVSGTYYATIPYPCAFTH